MEKKRIVGCGGAYDQVNFFFCLNQMKKNLWTQDYGQFCEEVWLFPGMFNMYVKKHNEVDKKEDKIRLGCKRC